MSSGSRSKRHAPGSAGGSKGSRRSGSGSEGSRKNGGRRPGSPTDEEDGLKHSASGGSFKKIFNFGSMRSRDGADSIGRRSSASGKSSPTAVKMLPLLPDDEQEGSLSYGADMKDSFPLVVQRTTEMTTYAKELAMFLKLRAQIELQYSLALKKLANNTDTITQSSQARRGVLNEQRKPTTVGERARKMASMFQPPPVPKAGGPSPSVKARAFASGMTEVTQGSMSAAWVRAQQATADLADAHAGLAERLRNDVVAPFDQYIEANEPARKMVVLTGHTFNKEVNEALDAVTKSRTEYVKLSKAAAVAKQNYDKVRMDPKVISKGASSSALTKATSKHTAAKEKAKAAEDKYKAAVTAANERQSRFFEQDIPKVLADLQVLDVEQTKQVQAVWDVYAKQHEPISKDWAAHQQAVMTLAPSIKAKGDVQHFIDQYRTGVMDVYEELSFVPSDAAVDNVFGVTLSEIMANQRAKEPALEVPRVLTTLCEATIELGGLETEGIFRLSATSSTLNRLRQDIESGKYDMPPGADAHVPACLLKQWFRSLHLPVIPTEMYPAATEASKGTSEDAFKLLKSIPEPNYSVLTYTIKFLLRFLEPGVYEHTRMDAVNIAIVFGPTLMRNPSTDPIAHLGSAQYEAAFIKLLLDYFGNTQDKGDLRASVPS